MDFLDCGRLSAVWNGCLDRIVVSVNRAAHARCISCSKAETKWVRILDFAVNEIGCSVFKARYPPLPLGDGPFSEVGMTIRARPQVVVAWLIIGVALLLLFKMLA